MLGAQALVTMLAALGAVLVAITFAVGVSVGRASMRVAVSASAAATSTGIDSALVARIRPAVARGARAMNAVLLAVMVSSCAPQALSLRVSPAVGMAPLTATAFLSPGRGSAIDLTCAAVTLLWGDESRSVHLADCVAGQANLVIRRHEYVEPGDYVLGVHVIDREGQRAEAAHLVRVRGN